MGLGDAKFIIYHNVKVYEYGTAAKLIADENTPLHIRNGDLKIEGR